MANSTISALSAATALVGTEVLETVQSAVSVKTTPNAIGLVATGMYNVVAYGAVIDDRVVTDAAVTASSATLTSATAGFTAADVGKSITVRGATQVAAPGAVSVSNIGTPGSTTYWYVVTCQGVDGGETTVSPEGTTATGNASLSSSNKNRLQWQTVTGARWYKIYRGSSSGAENLLVGYAIPAAASGTITFDDTVPSPGAGSPPGSNTAVCPLETTIAGFTNSTTITLGANATATGSSLTMGYGTDDTSALTSAVAAAHAAGGGTVLLPSGGANGLTAMRVSSSVTWFSKVNLIGLGPSVSIIRSYGSAHGTIALPTASSPQASDITMSNFQLDGSMMSDFFLAVASKGIQGQYGLRYNFINLYVHDYPATGIGCDFTQGTTYIGCTCNNNGRIGQYLNGFTFQGSSGFGIGTGAYAIEDTVLIGCTANGNGHDGIFFEFQGGQPFKSTGMKVIGCTANTNYNAGIADCGVSGMLIANNYVNGNLAVKSQGQIASYQTGGDGGKIIGNIVVGLGATNASFSDGIIIFSVDAAAPTAYTIENNRVSDCSRFGINLSEAGASNVQITARGNKVYRNASTGIVNHTASNFCVIEGNECFNNGQNSAAFSGTGPGILCTQNVNNISIRNNTCYDTQGSKTQTYGIQFGGTVTNGVVEGNNCVSNLTGGINVTGLTPTTCVIRNNNGHNPKNNLIQNGAAGASPWTYTASSYPEMVTITGATSASYTVGGNQIVSVGNAITGTLPTIMLEPNQVLVLTYSSTAPNVVSQQR
jgi:hypothetical protein